MNPLLKLSISKSHFLKALPFILIFNLGIGLGVILSSHFSPSASSLPSPPPRAAGTVPEGDGAYELNKLPAPVGVGHDLSEEKMEWRAAMEPRIGGKKKVAFMFLTKGDMPLAPLWELFFKGNGGLFSVYVHVTPSFNATPFPASSVFHGRNIPSKEVKWGEFSMVEAERRLLANALLDRMNQRFVLLSESCIPLFNFSTIYSYLVNSSLSFVESYDLPGPTGRGRYTRHLAPWISLGQWRKGSQWFEMDRGLAVDIVADHDLFPLFRGHCTRTCYADEHYLATLVSMKHGRRNSNRSLTWTNWEKGHPHPTRFYRNQVTVEFLKRIRGEGRCNYNGRNTTICFLFARKFTSHSLVRLLRFAPKLMRFNS